MHTMSCMRLNAHIDTSHHGRPHPFRDVGAVVHSLTGVYNLLVKCLFVVKWSCTQIKIWRPWRPGIGPSSTYPSVMNDCYLEHLTQHRRNEPEHHLERTTLTFWLWYLFQYVFQIMQEESSVVVVCKTMWQNMRNYQTTVKTATFSITLSLCSLQQKRWRREYKWISVLYGKMTMMLLYETCLTNMRSLRVYNLSASIYKLKYLNGNAFHIFLQLLGLIWYT
jgi:hypothetical protein